MPGHVFIQRILIKYENIQTMKKLKNITKPYKT